MALKKESSWYDIDLTKYPTLDENVHVDACIVGGGLTGVTAAYLLAKAGARVALIEKDRLASGATGVTTAFITSIIDTDMHDLVHTMDLARSRAVIESHRSAIDTIEKIVSQEKIDCDFERCDNYMFATEESEIESLDAEAAAARKLAFQVESVTDLPFRHIKAIRIKDQAKFHPLKYLDAVAKKSERIRCADI